MDFTGVREVASPLRARLLAPWARRLLDSPVLRSMAEPHGVSRYLELLSPLWALDEQRAVVTEVRRETPHAVTLRLRPSSGGVPFRAGQFVPLTVEVDGVRRTRCYSPSCAEGAEGLLELTVKAHSHGVVSRFLNEQASPGLVVGIGRADGTFALPEPRPSRTLLISGGSGITPVMSMLRTLCNGGHTAPVTFLHYAPSREELIFGDELETLAARHRHVRIVTVFTRSAPGALSAGLQGYFGPSHLDVAAPDYRSAEVYVCGPEGLVQAVRGVDGLGERVQVERFEASQARAAAPGEATGHIRFAASGVGCDNDGRTLLEQAEAAGLAPDHGCRMGVCHTCTRRLESGRVQHVSTGQECSEPGALIQLCVNAPVGDVRVDL
jgi:stearoyl-CoA 9-desaturase NADPH oxidoreductase